MTDDSVAIQKLVKDDPRYRFGGYLFVIDALAYAQDILAMGRETVTTEPTLDLDSEKVSPERHLMGQDLCEAFRQYSIQEYGYMARVVLKSWGIESTGDIGNIVYKLIDIGRMKKSANDRRDDFDEVFDFDDAFEKNFEITA